MMLTIGILGLAGFVQLGWCQTPMDFQPSSEAKLGVKYPNIEITPPGAVVQTLDRKWTLITVRAIQSLLLTKL